ncbi:MAG TPA: acyl-CoA dehydrogenase [Firmicutes bacterium]|nr:acyl-CoA dehydrogenase [Bacillota bacterium]
MDFTLSEEQKMLQESAREFALKEMLPTIREYEEERRVNHALTKKLGELGMLGIHLPERYGGSGYDYMSAVLVWEQLSYVSWTQTLTALGHGVLAGTVLNLGANESQKQKYLPPLCSGESIIAVGAVEPAAGSDAAAIETSARVDGDQWVINGSKNFITSGGLADTCLVLCQTDKNLGWRGIALIAVDTDTPGFSSHPISMVGDLAGDLSNLGFLDCRVPRENLIGEVGRGLHISLHGIDTARLFISAGALGITQSCLDASIEFARERSQFGKPIGSYQMIQDSIASLAAELMAIRWQVYYAAYLKSRDLPHAKELSAAKILASDLAVKASEEAIRIHGAHGCTDDYPPARHYRDSILMTILGGTREMHKLTIGRELLGLNARS